MAVPKPTSAYRALLRELPRRSLSSPTPLHNRVRELFREKTSSNTSSPTSTPTSTSTHSTGNINGNSNLKLSDEEMNNLQTAEQIAIFARAQRQYAALVERYNPGITMDEEEKIRLTARRVGLDLPVEGEHHRGSKKEDDGSEGQGEGEGEGEGEKKREE